MLCLFEINVLVIWLPLATVFDGVILGALEAQSNTKKVENSSERNRVDLLVVTNTWMKYGKITEGYLACIRRGNN